MKKRVQVFLNEDALVAVERLEKEANHEFDIGSISLSDAINEMILTSRVDIQTLQGKHTDLRKAVIAMADKPDVDIDFMIKNLQELKVRTSKKTKTAMSTERAR